MPTLALPPSTPIPTDSLYPRTIPQRVISGTSLAAVAATGSAAGYVYYTSGAVDLTSAALIAVAAVATAPLGARATKVFDCAMLRRLMAYWWGGVEWAGLWLYVWCWVGSMSWCPRSLDVKQGSGWECVRDPGQDRVRDEDEYMAEWKASQARSGLGLGCVFGWVCEVHVVPPMPLWHELSLLYHNSQALHRGAAGAAETLPDEDLRRHGPGRHQRHRHLCVAHYPRRHVSNTRC